MRNIAAIVLAAGEGTRMNSVVTNKVMLPLGGKPMLEYTIELLEKIGVKHIVVVVGFAKEDIINHFKDRVVYAVQNKRMGTGHATQVGMSKIPQNSRHVFLLNGDDSYNYKSELLTNLLKEHVRRKADVSFITIKLDPPFGIGRVIRDKYGIVQDIVEEKDATDEQKKINEVSPQCWIFSVKFLLEYLPKIEKSPVTGEIYVNALLKMAVSDGRIVVDYPVGAIQWRGVNRYEELEEARKIVGNR